MTARVGNLRRWAPLLLLAPLALAIVWWAERRDNAGEPASAEPAPLAAGPTRADLQAWLEAHELGWLEAAGDHWYLRPGALPRSRWATVVTAFTERFAPGSDPAAERFRPQVVAGPASLVPPAAGWLVLVIDDVGFRPSAVRRMLAWDLPMIFAVLPKRPYSHRLALEIAAAGRDLFVHMPMEPEGYPAVDPGSGALLLFDPPERWVELLQEARDAVPGIVGFNNHMGSAFTADLHAMWTVLAWAAEHDLFFLDSLTTQQSVVPRLCRKLEIRCAARRVFLDHERTPEAVDARISEWLRHARRSGIAVAIGHPYDVTMDRLEAAQAAMAAEGFRWVGFSVLDGYAEEQLQRRRSLD